MGTVHPEYARKVAAAKQRASEVYTRSGTEGLREELASLRRLDADPVYIAEIERTYHRAVKYDAQIAKNKAAANDPEQMSHAQLHRIAAREVRRQEESRARAEEEAQRRRVEAEQEEARERLRSRLRPRPAQTSLGFEESGFQLLHSPGAPMRGPRGSARALQRALFEEAAPLFEAPAALESLPELAPEPAPMRAKSRAKKGKAKASSDDARRLEIARSPIYKKWIKALRAVQTALDKYARNDLERKQLIRAFDKGSEAYNWLAALPLTQAENDEEHAKLVELRGQIDVAEEKAKDMRAELRRAELERIDELEREQRAGETRYVPGVGYVQGGRVIG